MIVKSGRVLFGLGTLKSTLSHEWIDEMSWFFASWYKLRKAKGYFNDYWVDMVKNHGTLQSSLSHKWFDELSRLTEWFLHADSDGTIFGLTTNLLCIVDI